MLSPASRHPTGQHNLQVNESKYYSLAVEVTNVVKQRFTMGAINRDDVIRSHNMSDHELNQYLEQLEAFGTETETRKRIGTLADISQTTLCGNCGVFTSYGIGYLRNKLKDESASPLIECIYLDRHGMLGIGRAPGSDRKDIRTWGNDALVCDIWADKIYFASQFRELQESVTLGREENILYREGVITNGIRSNRIHQGSYLAGNPEVYDGENSERYDRMLTAWVIEDMCRQEQPDLKSPSMPSVAPIATVTRLSIEQKKTLKDSFARITKFDNWTINEKSGLAVWQKDFTPDEAIRVEKILKLTKAAHVVRGTTKIDDVPIPMIKCDAIDYQKMIKLGSALQDQESALNLHAILGLGI